MKQQTIFPYYDTARDEIMGCKKFSMMWWHERGHQWIYKSGYHGIFEWIGGFLILFAIANVIKATENITAGYLFLIGITIFFSIEIGAWIYALQNRRKWRK